MTIEINPPEAFRKKYFPDSLPASRLGEELDECLVSLGDVAEPPPLDWLWDGLIPAGFATTLVGDGGTGKSWIALRLAFSVALAEPFLGRAVTQGNVLLVDVELDRAETGRRAYRVARGLGLAAPPKAISYLQLGRSLSEPESFDLIGAAIARVRPVLTIFDSLSVGSARLDLNAPEDMIEVMNTMKKWGTVLLLDHISKNTIGSTSGTTFRAFGTVFKYNLARSVLQLLRADAGGMTLTQIKSNFGRLQERIGLELEHDVDRVVARQLALDDEKLAGTHRMATPELLLAALTSSGDHGAHPKELAETLGVAEKTLRNAWTKLRGQNLVHSRRGRWHIGRAPMKLL